MVHRHRLPSLVHRCIAVEYASLHLSRAQRAHCAAPRPDPSQLPPYAWDYICKVQQLVVAWALAGEAERTLLLTVLPEITGDSDRDLDDYRFIMWQSDLYAAALCDPPRN